MTQKSNQKGETKESPKEKAKAISAAKSRSHWKLHLLPLWPKDNIFPPPWSLCRKGKPGALLGWRLCQGPQHQPQVWWFARGTQRTKHTLAYSLKRRTPKSILAVLLQLFMDMCKEVKNLSDPLSAFSAKVRHGDALPFYFCSHTEMTKGWRLLLWGQLDGVWIPVLAPVRWGSLRQVSLHFWTLISLLKNTENRIYHNKLIFGFKIWSMCNIHVDTCK